MLRLILIVSNRNISINIISGQIEMSFIQVKIVFPIYLLFKNGSQNSKLISH